MELMVSVFFFPRLRYGETGLYHGLCTLRMDVGVFVIVYVGHFVVDASG